MSRKIPIKFLVVLALVVPFSMTPHQTPRSSDKLQLRPSDGFPVLDVGDTWHYHYSGPEGDSTEKIVRSDNCGSHPCVVDEEANAAWNDTSWIDKNWNLSREIYIDHTTPYNYSNTYTPPLQLYHFPLHIGIPWWWNVTLAGWYTDQFGNHTQAPIGISVKRVIVNQTTVTVPAGTFNTYLVAQYVADPFPHVYRWFSTDAKTSVKWEIFDHTEAVTDSYVMTSYSLTPILPQLAITGLSPNPAKPLQRVSLDFTATELTGGDVTITTTWVDWGDGSMPDLLFNMTSESMCPRDLSSSTSCAIPLYSLSLARVQEPSSIVNGSIIIFRPYLQYPDYLVMHRIVAINPASGYSSQLSFVTRGDANPATDCWGSLCNLPASQVVAVYQSTLSSTGMGERNDTHVYPSQGSTISKTYTIRINATDENSGHTQTTTTETISQTPQSISWLVFYGIPAAGVALVGTTTLLVLMARKKPTQTL